MPAARPQVSYINDRFADKKSAQYWQFVIWLRQALLFADSEIGASLLQGTTSNEAVTLTGDKLVLWGHTAIAVTILLVAWRAHAVVQPYEYRWRCPLTPCPLSG